MSSKPAKPKPSALALRLAFLYTAFLAVSFSALFMVMYQLVDRIVQQRDRELIQAQVEKFSALYQHGGVSALANYFNQPVTQPDAVFVRIVDSSNRVHFITVSHPLWNLLDQRMRQTGDLHGKSRWDMLAQEEAEGSWMVGTQPLNGSFYLQVGLSNAADRAVMAHLRRTGLIILTPALLLSLLGGWLLSRSALSPLRALVDTTAHIVETGDLDRRVPEQRQRGELAELGTLFNTVLDQNRRLVESSRETLDNVAHDLRTPMTHLRNSAEHALQDFDAPPAQLREALADCMEESEKILCMLNALMDLAEARTGGMKLEKQSFAVRELADEVIELYTIVAEERGLELKNEIPTWLTLEADRLKLRQCLANLTDNALKYSDSGSIVLGGGSTENEVFLTVRDHGCGIAAKDLDRIWERLYRAENSRTAAGLGLGLSMVKAITEAHGGRAAAESLPHHGTVFTLTFPRA